MRNFLLMFCIGATALLANGAAFANDELIQLSKDPKQWVMPTGDYANRRYSIKSIPTTSSAWLQCGAFRQAFCAVTREAPW
jgi:hypothetical protein